MYVHKNTVVVVLLLLSITEFRGRRICGLPTESHLLMAMLPDDRLYACHYRTTD